MGDNGEESENDPVESDFETAESDSVSHDNCTNHTEVLYRTVTLCDL